MFLAVVMKCLWWSWTTWIGSTLQGSSRHSMSPGRAGDDAGNSSILQVLVRNRRGHHGLDVLSGRRSEARRRGRAALNVD
jgi:hypothetical protein